ncbi:MAG: ribose-phosphate diphosphokinase [Sphaerochaetaceae bacterium]|nr:ribose-phosphate diphosphokinase [Sphaerochaetaceae bacterium]
MSIIKPHKLGIITGPGSEYLAGRVVKHLRGLYIERYNKLSKNLAYRYGMSEEEILREVTFIDDLGNKKIPSGKCPKEYICPNFDIPVKYTRFLNGEVKSEIVEPVRGLRIYVIYDVTNDSLIKLNGCEEPVHMSLNDHIMMLFTICNALNLAGADQITLVLPTYPYARQDKKSSREPLSAAFFGQMCENLGVERIITLDIHSKGIENSFKTLHLDNLHASYQFLVELKKIIDISDPDITVVSPDIGAVGRNKFYAQVLHRPLAMLYKERDYSVVTTGTKNTNIKSINLLGDVQGKTVIISDDMLASGGTMLIAMKTLREKGAKKIICIVSLPFFNGGSATIETFDKAHQEGVFDYIIGTNAVYHSDELLSKKWFIQTDASELFARVISRLHHGRAISPLLDNRKIVQRLVDDVQSAAESARNEEN